jgi:hypothetical protein
VNSGTLNVTGSLASGSAVTVANATTLAGNGTTAGTVMIQDGGLMAPGSMGAGTLNTGAFTMGSTSVLNMDLGTSSDLVAVTGALTLDGILNVTAGAGFTYGVYPLLSYSGALVNRALVTGTMPAGYSYTVSATSSPVTLRVSVSPLITSDGGAATASINVVENQSAVTTVVSIDADGETPLYSITGGSDAGQFSIVAGTGVLTFSTAPNYEIPTDFGADNVYDVQVTVSDGYGGTDLQDISVTVSNVNEAPLSVDSIQVSMLDSKRGRIYSSKVNSILDTLSIPSGAQVTMTSHFVDPEGDPFVFAILQAPAGLLDSSYVPGFLRIKWTPVLNANDSIRLEATDSAGAKDTLIIRFRSLSNLAPQFSSGMVLATDKANNVLRSIPLSLPSTSIPRNASLNIHIGFDDPEGDAFELTPLNIPTTVNWYSENSQIHLNWQNPGNADTSFSIMATDDLDAIDTVFFSLKYGNSLPVSLYISNPKQVKSPLPYLHFFDLLGRRE